MKDEGRRLKNEGWCLGIGLFCVKILEKAADFYDFVIILLSYQRKNVILQPKRRVRNCGVLFFFRKATVVERDCK